MGVSKEAKEEIIKLMLQDVPTDKIALKTNYSISTIRATFEELRDEFGVNSKVGIARAYLHRKLSKLSHSMQEILKLLDSCQMTTTKKSRRNLQKHQK